MPSVTVLERIPLVIRVTLAPAGGLTRRIDSSLEACASTVGGARCCLLRLERRLFSCRLKPSLSPTFYLRCLCVPGEFFRGELGFMPTHLYTSCFYI
jgi:hypothetical protein